METFFFGSSSAQLLGVYHPADMSRDRYQGVVLCYPFGQEYMRAHRAFRQLAGTLAKKGFHVLRFDYRGTGDSSGELGEVTADEWLEDIECAVQELEDMAGVHRVTLVGLRLGGLLAGLVGARRRSIAGLVLWDPIVKGSNYIQQLEREVERRSARKKRSNFIDADGNLYINGFALSQEFQASLNRLNLLNLQPACSRILQVASHETKDFSALKTAWCNFAGFDYRHVPAEHDWNYVDHVGGILLPQPVLQEISHWM
jgi:exosortase A-associated hydrolase 2